MSLRRTHFSANPPFVKKKTVPQTRAAGGDVSAFLRNSPEAKQKEGNNVRVERSEVFLCFEMRWLVFILKQHGGVRVVDKAREMAA